MCKAGKLCYISLLHFRKWPFWNTVTNDSFIGNQYVANLDLLSSFHFEPDEDNRNNLKTPIGSTD
jgi:hypothetical protein